MTKRWELEVRGLKDVEVPTDRIRERSRRAPSGGDPESARSPRQRWVAAVVAFAVFIAAGAFAWRALRPSGSTLGGTTSTLPSDGTIVATFRVVKGQEGGSGPSATLSTSTEKIDGTPTSFSWATSQSVMNADYATPDFVATDFIAVIVGSSLVVDSDAPAVGGALEAPGPYPFAQVQSFGHITDPVRLDQPPGRYILHLIPAWDQGTVNYYFPIDLVAAGPTSTSGPDATLTFAAMDLPHASLSWGGTGQEAERGEFDWCGRFNRCGSGTPDWGGLPPEVPYLPIPVGTSLRLEGDVIDLTGSFNTVHDVLQRVSDVTFDDPGTVPTTPGRYVLKLDVDLRGSEGERGSATFFFGIEATANPTAKDLERSRWRLVSIDGVAIPAKTEPITLIFQTAHWLDGSDGCNNYTARYRMEGSSIRLVGGGVTDVFCSGEAEVRAQALAEGLRNATSFQLAGDRLTIMSPTTTLVFVPTYII